MKDRSRRPYHQSPSSAPEEPLYRMMTKTDKYGVEYRELVRVSPPRPEPQQRQRLVVDGDNGWSYDQHTGCMYRTGQGYQSPNHTAVNNGSWRPGSNSPHHHAIQARCKTVTTPAETGRSHHQLIGDRSRDRFPGIIPLDTDQAEQREGKVPKSIASHARDMPVEYAKSATAKNINLAMFMYGAISEIHSSRIGISPALEPGVLEAKLQHLLNVINVTCLNACPTDFKPVAWSVGRTYHNLGQAKVDSGRENWTDFEQYHRSSPHAAEMVAAEREHRVALNKPKYKPNTEKRGEVDKKEDQDKPVCTTWNNFEEEGKCRWESENPGEKCYKLHECRYCKKKHPYSRTKHQERFCKWKQEEDKKFGRGQTFQCLSPWPPDAGCQPSTSITFPDLTFLSSSTWHSCSPQPPGTRGQIPSSTSSSNRVSPLDLHPGPAKHQPMTAKHQPRPVKKQLRLVTQQCHNS